MRVQRYVALLRGVNVGGHRKIPMADLARIAATAGLAKPQTLLQSGNVIFEAALRAPDAAARLSRALESAFGVTVDVTVRDHAGLRAVVVGRRRPWIRSRLSEESSSESVSER